MSQATNIVGAPMEAPYVERTCITLNEIIEAFGLAGDAADAALQAIADFSNALSPAANSLRLSQRIDDQIFRNP